jgi:hypothetical protein
VALQTISSLNASAAVNKVWRKIQGDIAEGVNFMYEESDLLDDFGDVDWDWSQREATFPVDVYDAPRAAVIPDGGFRGKPGAVNLEEATASMSSFSATFTSSTLAKFADQGNENQLRRELVHKSKKSLESIARVMVQQFYGTSVGTLALTDTDLGGTTDTLVLKDAFGVADIDNAAFLSDQFRLNDRIAAFDGSTVADSGNAFGYVSANPKLTPGSLPVAWDVSLGAVTNNNLKIIGAGALGGGTSTVKEDDTDYNKCFSGLFDVMTSASVQGINSGTVPEWAIGYSDVAGGTLTPVRLHAMVDKIQDASGEAPDCMVIDKGVYRDLVNNERAAYQASSPTGIELDGSVKRKGLNIKPLRRCPPGYAFLWKKSRWQKKILTPKPSGKLSWGDGIDLIDKEGMLFKMFVAGTLVVKKRTAFGYLSGLTGA